MGKEIQNLKNNMTDQANRLSVLHSMALPKSLKRSQAQDVNQKIEDILTIVRISIKIIPSFHQAKFLRLRFVVKNGYSNRGTT
jgi:hypothetical protein